AMQKRPKVAEVEPNDEPEQATAIPTPGVATGTIHTPSPGDLRSPPSPKGRGIFADADLYRFNAKAGDQWIIETKAARAGSPLDTKVEVLDARGQPVPRLL